MNARMCNAAARWTCSLRLSAICCLSLLATPCRGEEPLWPNPAWTKANPAALGLDAARLRQARDFALSGGGSGYVVYRGRLVMAWGDARRRYDLKSTTKSIGVTALGLALGDGKVRLEDPAMKFQPELATPPAENRKSGWIDKITLKHLATQTAGFEKPGGYTRLTFKPGTQWAYSDGGPNWLAECLTLAYRRDLRDLLFERVFTPLGIEPADLSWRQNSYRAHKINGVARREFGSGVSANVDAMARLGYLYLREGKWRDRQLLPRNFVAMAATTVKEVVGLPEADSKNYGNASDHYGLLWWNNADGTLKDVPRDAYWSWGLYDSLILVVPSLDLVAARAGKSWKRDWAGHYDVLQPFFSPLVAAVPKRPAKKNDTPNKSAESKSADAPYPPSPVIAGLEWAPASTIVRRAQGGDNWPLTWGDDDALYTAYGDGYGFKPFVPRKLSLGLARIEGSAERFTGVNLRSPTAEQTGQGAAGKKASGLLMVDGVLYMWVRNADNSQLAWSADRGRTWAWSDWKFTTSFGCPTFLNFGKNYSGARDDFVYVYSHDSPSAYKPADRMVLARAPKKKLRQREAYEFFAGMQDGQPTWRPEIARRAAVFEHAGKCYRSGVSYHAGTRRYLWAQILPGGDTRFEGGLGVSDAPSPWGPWTTCFFTRRWDVGPGETASFPTKWMSPAGNRLHLVFSGNDSFSVRQGRIKIREMK